MPVTKKLENSLYSFEEVAQLYAVTTHTLRKRLAPYMEQIGKPEKNDSGIPQYSAQQMHIIKEILMADGSKS
jgi:DNA-binding transcriptional MerR regulator